MSVCGQVRRGRKISFNADQWFALFLAGGDQGASNSSAPKPPTACTLLRSVEAPPKRGEYSAAENRPAGSAEISFANTAQFLLLSLESVRTLTQVLYYIGFLSLILTHSFICIVLTETCRIAAYSVLPRRRHQRQPQHQSGKLSPEPCSLWGCGAAPPRRHLAAAAAPSSPAWWREHGVQSD